MRRVAPSSSPASRSSAAAPVGAQDGVEHVLAPAAADLQVALGHALAPEAGPLQQRPRGDVLRQAGRLDAAEVDHGEGVVHHRRQRLAHQPLAGELRADPVADLRRLRRPAADVVERDRPHQPRILAPDQEERQRPALLARPPRPVDPVAEGPAREVVRRPARLPVAQEALAAAAQHAPRRHGRPSPAAAGSSARSRSQAARSGGS